MHLGRLCWLVAAFCALAMLCVATHATAFAGATAHVRVNVSAHIAAAATALAHAQAKDCIWGFDQNSPRHVCALRFASAEKHQGISPALSETASVSFYAAEEGGHASDAISGARLANQLVYEEASSAFAATGELLKLMRTALEWELSERR